SFTDMPYVSNREEWYTYLEDESPEFDFFVGGFQGYNSVQEFLLIEEFIEEIDPEIIIWQFHKSDIRNNYPEFARKYYPYVANLKLPFLEEGKIKYKYNVRFGKLRDTSYIFRLFQNLHQKYKLEVNPTYKYFRVESLLVNGKNESFERAKNTTLEIFEKYSNLTKNISVFLFSPGSTHPELINFEKQICIQNNFTYIGGLTQFLDSQNETITISDNTHWNKLGNRLAGKFLAHELKKFEEFN
ncbi:hypothetical protein ACFL2V_16285, partial [Pseudomonadota bacterium]